jgi:hypothetical protein
LVPLLFLPFGFLALPGRPIFRPRNPCHFCLQASTFTVKNQLLKEKQREREKRDKRKFTHVEGRILGPNLSICAVLSWFGTFPHHLKGRQKSCFLSRDRGSGQSRNGLVDEAIISCPLIFESISFLPSSSFTLGFASAPAR